MEGIHRIYKHTNSAKVPWYFKAFLRSTNYVPFVPYKHIIVVIFCNGILFDVDSIS